MTEEILSVETPEVADPTTEEIESVETQEVADPEGEEAQEVAVPAKSDQDSWYAEKRRELEAKEREIIQQAQAQIEAERQRALELEAKTKEYEKRDKLAQLKEYAEQAGLDYDTLVEEVEREEELEEKHAKTTAELEAERQAKEQLSAENQALKTDLAMLKMSMEDKEELLALDPTIKLNELSEDFYKLRFGGGYSPTEAYKMAQALIKPTSVAESPGKINSSQAETEYYTEAEWDSMSSEQQDKLINDPATWPKVQRSHKKWLET